MDELVNTNGPGPVGTRTNTPICDDATMACNQNRPAVPHGTGANVGIPGWKPGLTKADSEWLSYIPKARNPNGSPLTIEQLTRLRSLSVKLLEEAITKFGPASSSAIWCQKVVAAYDQAIANAKSPLGSAINELRTAVADPSSTEQERREKVSILTKTMKQDQILGTVAENDPRFVDGMNAISDAVKRHADEKNSELEDIVNREKRSSGSVPDSEFSRKIEVAMGAVRSEVMLGIPEGDGNQSKLMGLVVDSLNLVADRRINSLKTLINQEKRSPGSVSEQQFVTLVKSVIGDERQKEMLGLSDSPANAMEPVFEVMKLFLDKRRAAIASLFRKQQTGGGVTEKQIDQALADYEIAKRGARQWGLTVVDAPDIPDQEFKAEHRPR